MWMARPIQIDMRRVAQARLTVKATRNLDDFKSALAVLLPAQVGLTLDETARMLGVGTASVNRLQARLPVGRTSWSERRNWGGRRQSLYSRRRRRLTIFLSHRNHKNPKQTKLWLIHRIEARWFPKGGFKRWPWSCLRTRICKSRSVRSLFSQGGIGQGRDRELEAARQQCQTKRQAARAVLAQT